MKLFDNQSCALCQEPLKWWNVQSCTQCGRPLCGHHAVTKRRPHSTILFVLCSCCAGQPRLVSLPKTTPAVQREILPV